MRNFLSDPHRCLSRRSRAERKRRISLECLEDRELLTSRTFTLNDPDFLTKQWGLNNIGQSNVLSAAGGIYGMDMDMPEAWSITTGTMATVVAVMDDGVDYTSPDLYLNIWLNQGEIPASFRASLADTDNDTFITFRDLNASANAAYVSDLNGNGIIDGGDLLTDARWEDGVDGEGNGRVDDLIGWDFQDNDNDPMPGSTGGHGTWMSQQIGGIPNNGIGAAGVNWRIRMMPVRLHTDGNNINYNNAASGLDYAVANGATLSNNSWGSFTYSQVMYDAISRARSGGHLFVASAGNDGIDIDLTPRYPAAFDLDNIVSVGSFDPNGNRINNWGHNSVDLAAPTPGGTSGSSSNTTGVAALLKAVHPEWGYAQIKDRILSTVDVAPEFAELNVSGGRLNAAYALAATSIAIDSASIMEGDSGTAQRVFTIRRVGDSSGTVVVNWSTADGTATAPDDYIAATGQITFPASGGNIQTITVTVLGDLQQEPTESFFVDLVLDSGSALLADSSAQGKILDNETKFFVVNEDTVSRTFQYSTSGIPGASSNLASRNTAPRGIASDPSGTRLWVVDASKTVFVYDRTGALLGSWTTGIGKAYSVEGITTDGSDIWIVGYSSGKDKVFRYAGAAGRLQGSQSPTSNFSLASADTRPMGIATDGKSLWVVDSGVFKYSLSGALLGSWTIDPANNQATGITIDFNNPSDIWIVDKNYKVYQYSAATDRTSGGQNASAIFPLAGGNNLPQDIADPPVAGVAIPTPSRIRIRHSRAAASRDRAEVNLGSWYRDRTDEASRELPHVKPESLMRSRQRLLGMRGRN